MPARSPNSNRIVKRVMAFAAKKVPKLKHVQHRFCALADMEHRLHKRQFAHTYCNDPKLTPAEKKLVKNRQLVCWARAMMSLPAHRVAGICLHELGHLLAGPMERSSRFAQEMGADVAVLSELGVEIKYLGCHNDNAVDLKQLER
jgi:hypothetical protein